MCGGGSKECSDGKDAWEGGQGNGGDWWGGRACEEGGKEMIEVLGK